MDLTVDKTTTKVLVCLEREIMTMINIMYRYKIERRIFNKNIFGKASAIEIGLLTCQGNYFLQTSQPGSIETIKN